MSLLVDSLKDRLLLAVPKKGRLHEKCVELLSGMLISLRTGPGELLPVKICNYAS
jgi:ATP phosphoribosyltransferase